MKWQHNPESIEFGMYAYKQKNTETPTIVNVSIETGIPTDTRGWWLGPLRTETVEMDLMACVCSNCKCWMRKGNSPHGNCTRFPPVDNNWSRSQETHSCFEFIPKENLND